MATEFAHNEMFETRAEEVGQQFDGKNKAVHVEYQNVA